jgi:RNA polymerase sigma-70 factor, ECF subfamily
MQDNRPDGMNSADNQGIIRKCKAGDGASFSILVREHYALAYGLALRMVCDEADAEDVAQEAFIRVWRSLDRFDENTRFTTWLYRIVTNLSLDQLRSRRRRLEHAIDRNEGNRDPADPADHEAITANGDLARIVRHLSGGLPETQRLVFALRDLQDLPIATVCEITGLSSESVRTNLHYARRNIRERLEREYSVKGGSS